MAITFTSCIVSEDPCGTWIDSRAPIDSFAGVGSSARNSISFPTLFSREKTRKFQRRYSRSCIVGNTRELVGFRSSLPLLEARRCGVVRLRSWRISPTPPPFFPILMQKSSQRASLLFDGEIEEIQRANSSRIEENRKRRRRKKKKLNEINA